MADAQLCGDTALPTLDGRLLGHFPYGDVPDDELVSAPPGFALNGCMIRKEMLPDLTRLVAAANGDPAMRGQFARAVLSSRHHSPGQRVLPPARRCRRRDPSHLRRARRA